MVRRIVKIAAVVLLVGLIVPQAVEAASALFTSGSAATPAVKGVNSAAANGAKAVEGFASGTTGSTYGVLGTSKSATGFGAYGQNQSPTGKAIGLYGKSVSPLGHAIEGYAASPAGAGCVSASVCQHFGVAGYAQGGSEAPQPLISGVFGSSLAGEGWANGVTGVANVANTEGVGLRGYAASGYGVIGEGNGAGILGFGTGAGPAIEGAAFGTNRYGVLSDNDLGVMENLVGTANLAGACLIAESASTSGSSCTTVFSPGFPTGDGVPIIVVTPVGDPGGYWWISSWSSASGFHTGFTITRSATPATVASFNYIAVGLDGDLSARPSRRAHRARFE